MRLERKIAGSLKCRALKFKKARKIPVAVYCLWKIWKVRLLTKETG